MTPLTSSALELRAPPRLYACAVPMVADFVVVGLARTVEPYLQHVCVSGQRPQSLASTRSLRNLRLRHTNILDGSWRSEVSQTFIVWLLRAQYIAYPHILVLYIGAIIFYGYVQ